MAQARLAEKERQNREKELEKRRKNYKSPAWTSEAPRPFVDPTIWDDRETNDRLATYIDWHRRHPHSVTPRARDEVLVEKGKDIQIASPRTQVELMRGEDKNALQQKRQEVLDPKPIEKHVYQSPKKKTDGEEKGEQPATPISPFSSPVKEGEEKKEGENVEEDTDDMNKKSDLETSDVAKVQLDPGEMLVYYSNGVKPTPLSPEFQPPRIGANGRMTQVTKLSQKFQYHARIAGRYHSDDPWYTTSVKDGLETYHIDGDHTSVKSKPPKPRQKSAEQIAFEKDMAWKQEQYGRYKGGGPSLSTEQQIILEQLAITVPNAKDKKDIVGPWEDPHKWSKFTEEGTLLEDFNVVDLERKIQNALVAHEELIEADEKRRKKLKQERLAAKRATMERLNASRNTTPATRPQSSQIHPMGRSTIPEGDENTSAASPDGRSLRGDEVTFAGDQSVSSMGALTADGSLMGMTLDGGPSGTIEGGGGSLASGSTYRHKGHGGATVGPLSIGTGASQQKAYIKGGPPVDEATVQAALDYVGFKEGEGDGTTLDGASVNGAGAQSVVSALDSIAEGGTLGGESSTVVTAPKEKEEASTVATAESSSADSKMSKKLRNKLKAKGLSEGRGDSTENTESSSSRSRSMMSSMLPSVKVSLPIPDLGFMASMKRLGVLKRKAGNDDDEFLAGSSKKKKKKKKKGDKGKDKQGEEKGPTDEELLSDSEDEEDKEALFDKYDLMRQKLGGDEELEKQGDAWLKFAAHVRKKAKRDTNVFETSVDLPDAVDKNNLTKTVFMLAVNGADPNMKANNEEPLVINVIAKIILQDNITGSLEDDEDETPDRKRAFRILQALVKFKVELNTIEAKNGVPPLHMAVQAGNYKLIRYLIEEGADPNFFSKDDTTALMNAAKYGHIKLMAWLIRNGALLRIKDKMGRNVLHHAAMWGQTRSALFLLRCGCDKRIRDNDKLTAGGLAEERDFPVTGQAIMTFAVQPYRAQFALQYFLDQDAKANEPPSLLDNVADAAMAALGEGAKAVSKAFNYVGASMKAAGGAIMGMFGLSRKESKPSLTDF